MTLPHRVRAPRPRVPRATPATPPRPSRLPRLPRTPRAFGNVPDRGRRGAGGAWVRPAVRRLRLRPAPGPRLPAGHRPLRPARRRLPAAPGGPCRLPLRACRCCPGHGPGFLAVAGYGARPGSMRHCSRPRPAARRSRCARPLRARRSWIGLPSLDRNRRSDGRRTCGASVARAGGRDGIPTRMRGSRAGTKTTRATHARVVAHANAFLHARRPRRPGARLVEVRPGRRRRLRWQRAARGSSRLGLDSGAGRAHLFDIAPVDFGGGSTLGRSRGAGLLAS